jgi:hypothetical protein
MKTVKLVLILATVAGLALPTFAAETPTPWRVIIANDTCPDVTWGFTPFDYLMALQQNAAAVPKAPDIWLSW